MQSIQCVRSTFLLASVTVLPIHHPRPETTIFHINQTPNFATNPIMKLAAVISTVLLGAVPVLAGYRPGHGPTGRWFKGTRAWCQGLPDGGGDPIGDACRGVKIDTVRQLLLTTASTFKLTHLPPGSWCERNLLLEERAGLQLHELPLQFIRRRHKRSRLPLRQWARILLETTRYGSGHLVGHVHTLVLEFIRIGS